jgi:hypothetical protein
MVLDHGGPVELVPQECGYTLPMEARAEIVTKMRALFTQLIADPSALANQSVNAQAHVRRHFTWEAKAQQLHEVYRWVLGRRAQKPSWGVPFEFVALGEENGANATDVASEPVALCP